ncbi:MAG: DegV family protein [Ardenticatenia bacterium]|nr:DegV family protein [Ardenticatenia bacterium]
MSRIAVVTDSTADLSPEECEQQGIFVVPMNIHIDGRVYRDGVDIRPEEFAQIAREAREKPYTTPPTVQQFIEVYRRASEVADEIISIHISRKLSPVIERAEQASLQMMGRCHVHPVDSRLTTAGLGLLAKAAVEAARRGDSVEEIVRTLRGLINHIYVVFFVETLDFLEKSGRINRSQAILGTMLNIKPILMVEEGEIEPLEKVRTRERAIEKLAEFVAEFGYIEQIIVLHNQCDPGEIETLIGLIRDERPQVPIHTQHYRAALAAHIGVDAVGIVVSEGMVENPWDWA